MAAAFVIYAVLDGSPFTYTYKGKTYPDTDALIWRYGDLTNALESGSGICGPDAPNLIKTKALLNLYMNKGGVVERLAYEKAPDVRFLHLQEVDPEGVEVFVPYGSYTERVSRDECARRFPLQ